MQIQRGPDEHDGLGCLHLAVGGCRERDQGSAGLTEGLMGGLMGRAMGGMLGGVARQLQQKQQQVSSACIPDALSGVVQREFAHLS